MAPEVLDGNYDERADLWSIGVILYVMLSGRPPFDGSTEDEILAKVKIGKFEFREEYWADKSSDVQDLIKRLIEVDPEKRISAKDAINHKWIKTKIKQKFDKKLINTCLDELKTFRNKNTT